MIHVYVHWSDIYLRIADIVTQSMSSYLNSTWSDNILERIISTAPSLYPPNDSRQKIISRIPYAARSSRFMAIRSGGRARVLKESSIKGKKKNREKDRKGGGVKAQDISPGAAITSVTSIPGSGRGKSFIKSSSRKERDTSIPTRHTSAATVLF